MADFQAKERETAATTGLKPGEGPPVCPTNYLGVWCDLATVSVYYHRHKTHSKTDVVKPGYFNPLREQLAQQLRNGEAFIKCFLGERADGLLEVNLHVAEAKMDPGSDVIVAVGESRKYTPVRHDGSASGDETIKRGKAA